MKDWLIVLSIVWLLAIAGILFLGQKHYLFAMDGEMLYFVDPTPMPGILGTCFGSSYISVVAFYLEWEQRTQITVC